MTVLVCGGGGLLGTAIAEHLQGRHRVRKTGRAELQSLDDESAMALLEETRATLIVNCAADTDAEGAEDDDRAAVAANVMLPRILAKVCARKGILMIHFSSTGCYGDWKTSPYCDDDPLYPTTRHHQTKAEGEKAVRDAGGKHLIIRTGWLFGGAPTRPRNFVVARMREAATRERLISDATQFGCPTWVNDVARQTERAIKHGVEGTVNLVAHGRASRCEYVTAIVAIAGLSCLVEPGPAFCRKAPVSTNETAVNGRLQDRGIDIMPEWREGIARYVETLRGSPFWDDLTRLAA